MKPQFVRLLWFNPAGAVGFVTVPTLASETDSGGWAIPMPCVFQLPSQLQQLFELNLLLGAAIGAIVSLAVALAMELAAHRRHVRLMREAAAKAIATEVAERTRTLSQSRESLIEELKELRNSESRLHCSQSVVEETTGRFAALSTLDSVTNLANHERFSEYMEQQWRRASRSREPMSLILVSVDWYRQFSETYGLGTADDCLRAVAEVLETTVCRPGDLVARVGRDEFAVLMCNSGIDVAMHVARQIEAITEQLSIEHETTKVLGTSIVTVSIGVATASPDSTNAPSLLIYHADEALYAAKQDGCNCIRSYEDSTGTRLRSPLLEASSSSHHQVRSAAQRSRR